MKKKRVTFRVLVGRMALVGIAMLFVALVSTGCPPSPAGDYAVTLEGEARRSGRVGLEGDGRLFSVDVETRDTAGEVGPRLTELMTEAGIVVDCERYDGRRYIFLLRNLDGMPDEEPPSTIIGSVHGPVRDRPGHIEFTTRGFFINLNQNDVDNMRAMTTPEFFDEQVSDIMASMAANGEQVVIESMEEQTLDCYQTSISLELVWEAGTEQRHVDGYLTLSRDDLRGTGWMFSGGLSGSSSSQRLQGTAWV